ncbi:bifunctional phosphopantothenoylcysteine decarboxylase/phosphopantothenate--cysteine ligase CoaBC [Marinospirillum alkaliphilum]|uniref:Coenzyme A biosynthesis bifunctional protein CoaBC n=1 Tax=Marinospirillum alkaliphilum DSM 21637 TaxID=1122209 RepID=A0A1K1W6V7_9GAMM|nr:bifunctional phosphopantothenoylcysteine decarboxylase/phosphopantothenate--cysteine ligase CoaBC [Marinospirillum alkaliphilum]SFX32915.1 phosphopantothenoylcysteine decarboxylase / phosphopantothenate--cysteine ligase [Marinospirillum alkaliphilum DSM 21637]
MTGLTNKRLLLGVSGGIAAYKTAFLARLLVKAGAEVRVVMTDGAQAFVQPLTFQALTGHPVHTTLLDPEAEAGMGHIELARWADLILIAPASADLMARLAGGLANDLLSTLCLATPAPVHLAPAMNQGMWQHPATQHNASLLAQLGYTLIPPESGEQACGDVGPGRMPEPETLLHWIEQHFATATNNTVQPATGLRITITAGPTREPLDPVRYLSNHSSGKMGYALAAAAAELGAEVHLISGPVQLAVPAGVQCLPVTTAEEMLQACEARRNQTDLFIACAAVADYRAEQVAEHKIKKQSGQDAMTLTLVKNPDILAQMATGSPRPFCVGFAAETQNVEGYAQDKLLRKNLDAIVANDVSDPGIGFGSDDNRVTLLLRKGEHTEIRPLPQNSKQQLARQLLLELLTFYKEQQQP